MFFCFMNRSMRKNENKKPQAHTVSNSRRAWQGTSLKASLTVEAALSLPIVLFAAVLLMMPMKIMDTHRKMQAVAETVCADVSKYAYTGDKVKDGVDKIDRTGIIGTIVSYVESGSIGVYTASKAKKAADDNYLKNVSGLRTRCFIDDDVVTIVLDYKYSLPFVSFFGLGGLSQTAVSSRRGWVGLDGALGGDKDGDDDDDEWVWIGANSTRYHLTPDCHYLSNVFISATVDASGKSAYSGGRKYTPCDRCGKNAKPGQSVFVLKAGGKFHTTKDCNSLAAYVKKVKKSSVEYLGPCSYCGKGK